jgi:hypothetical protein
LINYFIFCGAQPGFSLQVRSSQSSGTGFPLQSLARFRPSGYYVLNESSSKLLLELFTEKQIVKLPIGYYLTAMND